MIDEFKEGDELIPDAGPHAHAPHPSGHAEIGTDVDPVAAVAALADVPWEPGAPKPDPILIADSVVRKFGGRTCSRLQCARRGSPDL